MYYCQKWILSSIAIHNCIDSSVKVSVSLSRLAKSTVSILIECTSKPFAYERSNVYIRSFDIVDQGRHETKLQ